MLLSSQQNSIYVCIRPTFAIHTNRVLIERICSLRAAMWAKCKYNNGIYVFIIYGTYVRIQTHASMDANGNGNNIPIFVIAKFQHMCVVTERRPTAVNTRTSHPTMHAKNE